jgi:hypothetical protein
VLLWLAISVILVIAGAIMLMAGSMSDDPYSGEHAAATGFIVGMSGAASLFAFLATVIIRAIG